MRQIFHTMQKVATRRPHPRHVAPSKNAYMRVYDTRHSDNTHRALGPNISGAKHLLAKHRAAVTPMKPKKGADVGQVS